MGFVKPPFPAPQPQEVRELIWLGGLVYMLSVLKVVHE